MAKESGLGNGLYLDEYDLSLDAQQIRSLSKSLTTFNFTGIKQSAHERKAGKLDAAINATSFFNPTNAHIAYSALPRTDRLITFTHRDTLGAPAASMVGKQMGYPGTRDTTGMLTFAPDALGNRYWLDWGLLLTAGLRTDTGATNGTGVDFTSAGSFGLQAYLHVTAFTGTDATITLQQSSDNGSGDAFSNVTGGSFTQVTGTTFERLATARDQAVERYLRVVTTTSGGFSSLSFVVNVMVNRTDYTL